MFSLEHKSILVTGASSGIGKCIARNLSEQGAGVVITGRNRSRLEDTSQGLSGDENIHTLLTADLTNRDERMALVAGCPQLNGVVFCAGVIDYLPAKLIDEGKIRSVIQINFESQILLYQELHAKKKLLKGASLVFISSVSARSGVPGTLLYAASKAAVSASVRVLASELSKFKIRVNSISPGLIRTPLLDHDEIDSETMKANEARYPLGMGTPDDVAHAAIFLLSDESRWITGIDLVVDGGYMIRK